MKTIENTSVKITVVRSDAGGFDIVLTDKADGKEKTFSFNREDGLALMWAISGVFYDRLADDFIKGKVSV